MLACIYAGMSVLLTFCNQRSDAHVAVTATPDSLKITDSMVDESLLVGSPEKHAFAEFGAAKGNTVLRLRDWRKDIDMNSIGSLKDTTMRVLGDGADTHIGALLQTYTYDDIILEFYGPKNGTDHWLLKMDLTGPEWSTARGVHVGDPLEDVLILYPRASNESTGDKNLYRYTVDESTLEFVIRDNKVDRISVIYNIP